MILPSMPGYGFSGKPTGIGWGPDRIARAWAELMKRLGYTRYVAQGGDWGSPVSSAMARQAPPGLLGIHINLPATVPPEVAAALGGGPAPAGLTDTGTRGVRSAHGLTKKGNLAYFTMMTARPQTVGYGTNGLAGRPRGLAADASWLHAVDIRQRSRKVADERRRAGRHHAVLADEQRDFVGAALLGERRTKRYAAAVQKTAEISLPVAITVFPDEVYRAPETWARRAYRNLIYFHEVDKGGHFAAWEQPELFSAELRAAFGSLVAEASVAIQL